jgi:hypothetical protein
MEVVVISLRIAALLLLCTVSSSLSAQDYIIIGWNDLGMHCSNQDFSTLVVLPPYNNVRAQVIRVGDAQNLPEVVTSGLRVTYAIPGNTYSVGKTNFWDYEDQLFGVSLPPDIGLTGVGLSGEMATVENYFHVEGIPITPYVDANLVNEDPFQLGLLNVYDASDLFLASTQPVVPVSNEINCVSSGCHSSEQAILNQHDDEDGFDPNATPILCASCHSSNALGTTGQPGLPSLSEAIHKKHGDKTNDCYRCHPGPNTQCLRDVMKVEHGFTCQTCHGSVTQVGESISSGREPWFEEPSCGSSSCHGATYAEEPGKLFRESRGHGGLFCSACHGEPHAIVPSGEPRDNVQNIALQGYAGTLNNCVTCHGVVPNGPGPHGITVGTCCLGRVGDANGSGMDEPTIGDISILIDAKFIAMTCDGKIVCLAEADINQSGGATPTCNDITIGDISYLIDYLFIAGPNNMTLPDCF